jgi:hypothetical protein
MWFELSRNRIAGELSLAWLADLLELPHSVAKKLDLLADLLWVGLPGSGIAVFLNQAPQPGWRRTRAETPHSPIRSHSVG